MKSIINKNLEILVFFCLILIFVFLFFTNAVPFIYADGYGSFHTSQCMANELSFVCDEKPVYFPYHSEYAVAEYNGKYVTVYSPGSAILNFPGQVIANVLSDGATMQNDIFMATKGHTSFQGLAFVVTAMICSIASILLIYKALQNFGYTKRLSMFATFTGYASSYAIWYVFLKAAFNHTYEIFGLSILLYALSLINKSKYWPYLASTGIGIALLCRPPLVIAFAPILLYLLLKKDFKNLVKYIGSFLPFVLIWMLYNQQSYDHLFVSGYDFLWNQSFVFGEWNGLNLLFSKYRGYFLYSPIFVFAAFGFLWLVVNKLKNAKYKDIINIDKFITPKFLAVVTGLFIFSATVIVYGFWPIWWGGESYGQRFLISFLPFMVLGVAEFIVSLKLKNIWFKKINLYSFMLSLMVVMTLWSIMFTILYRITPTSKLRPDNDDTAEMVNQDRYTQIDILNYQFSLIKNANGPKDYVKDLINSISEGINLPAYWLGMYETVLFFEMNNNEIIIHKVEPKYKNYDLNNIKVEFFIENGKFLQRGILTLDENIDAYNITCTSAICITTNNNIQLTLISSLPNLPLEKYQGVQNNLQNIFIYAEENENIYIKGDKLKITLRDEVY